MIIKYYGSYKVWYQVWNPYAQLLLGVWKGKFVQIQRFL